MLERYYQEELASLRDLAREFSRSHPAIAPYLSGPSADPDVERLLEGVAFLTGMLRQKLDDEFPEIVNELIELIWPHYLRPIPCTAIVAFSHKPGLKQPIKVPKETALASIPVDGTSCVFRTCQDVVVHPASITEITYRETPGRPVELCLTIGLDGMTLSEWDIRELDFYLGGDYATACDLYHLLCTCVEQVRIHPIEDGDDLLLPSSFLQPLGFSERECLIPYPSNSFPGYRIIQEYFINPRKFLFVGLRGLERWSNRGNGSQVEISFQIRQGDNQLPPLGSDSFVMSAVPVINIFPGHAQPVQVDHRSFKYQLKVASSNPDHYEIYSVESVTGLVRGTTEERVYRPFQSLGTDGTGEFFYNITTRPSISGAGVDWYISVSYPDENAIRPQEVLSVELMCTNGHLPEGLHPGDIRVPTSSTPEFIEFKNITNVSPCMMPSREKDLLWRLISHLNLNYQSIANARNLKALLKLYVFTESRNKKHATVNLRRIDGIEDLRCQSVDRLLSGRPYRGIEIALKARQDHFASKGDLYLFGSILERFLSGYAALNSFVSVILQESYTGELFRWPPRTGDRVLI